MKHSRRGFFGALAGLAGLALGGIATAAARYHRSPYSIPVFSNGQTEDWNPLDLEDAPDRIWWWTKQGEDGFLYQWSQPSREDSCAQTGHWVRIPASNYA